MTGIILLSILGLLVLVMLIALFLPGYIQVSYENVEFKLAVRYFCWSFEPLRLMNKLGSEKEKPRKSVKKKDPPKEKKEHKFQSPNYDQIRYSVEVLPDVLIRAARRALKKLRIAPLKIHVLVAGTDPADTAVLYGYLHAALGAILPPLHQAVTIKDQDIQLFPDFAQEQMDIIFDIGVGMRIIDMMIIALSAVGGVLKWYKGYKKRATKPVSKQNDSKNISAGSDHAA